MMKAEVTWDLVMSDDMPFIEGCYRLEGGSWEVVIAWKRRGRWEPAVKLGLRWKSGVRGMNVILHDDELLNGEILLRIMSEHLGVQQWTEVRGPDSIMLR